MEAEWLVETDMEKPEKVNKKNIKALYKPALSSSSQSLSSRPL